MKILYTYIQYTLLKNITCSLYFFEQYLCAFLQVLIWLPIIINIHVLANNLLKEHGISLHFCTSRCLLLNQNSSDLFCLHRNMMNDFVNSYRNSRLKTTTLQGDSKHSSKMFEIRENSGLVSWTVSIIRPI